MNVLIVNTNRERSPHTLIPMGACCVASATASAGHEVRFLDLTFAHAPARAAANAVKRFRPDVVGLSIRNIDNCDRDHPKFCLPEVREIALVCKSAGRPIIALGGPAVTTSPESALEYVGGDYAIAGEGERSFPALLESLEAGSVPLAVQGVTDGAKSSSPRACDDLASLPDASPERWLDLARYRRCDAAMPVQTKKGCLFHCSYCIYPKLEGEGVRLRSPATVANDVVRASRLGFRSVEFVDSVFNVPQEHAITCCDAIASAGSKTLLQSLEMNPLGSSPDLVRAMNAAGFCAIGCTAESASDEMLVSLQKGFSADDLRRAAREFRALDAKRMWIFMLGGPGETEKTVAETSKFIEMELAPSDLVYVSRGIRILPGTELHATAIAEGVVSPEDDLLRPTFYFSPQLTPEKAMEIVFGSTFPSANIISLSDGNSRVLPILQRAAHVAGISPPYWRHAPTWNMITRAFRSGRKAC
jgi:radical SAM superfamily enzyme YgiQ (UPF0313 family)